MNNITINSNSNDIKEMEKLFPRAPLKIIAMEGCKELGQKVNGRCTLPTFWKR